MDTGRSSPRTPELSAFSGSPPVSQRPSGVMPIGTTSWPASRRAFITARADCKDTSCSPERPPNRTPTRPPPAYTPNYLAKQGTLCHTGRVEWLSQARRGVIELCVLALIARAPQYGYQLATALADLGKPLAASEGTLYPLLRRLQRDGLVEATWQ